MAEHEDNPIVGMDGSSDEADEPEITSEAPDHHYSEDELEDFARTVEGYLSKCAYGQPYDGGEAVWLNPHTTLHDAWNGLMYQKNAETTSPVWCSVQVVLARTNCGKRSASSQKANSDMRI
jgi:hypothetical protein